MGNTTENVQVNMKLNGINEFKAYADLKKEIIAQDRLVGKMDKGAAGYADATKRLRELKDMQSEWRNEIYKGGQTQKTFFDDFKAGLSEITRIGSGVAIGSLVASGIQSAIGWVKNFMGASQEAYREAEINQSQLSAAVKSTGGAAGITKDQLNDLSAELMKLTGVDDDLITKSEALLLTFTNISGQLYDETLPLILDVSQALGQDLQTSTIQVGKALNDPINGLTALKRVGVSFSEDQKKVIKKLQETGDMAGAQTVILNELKKEFGGVSEAAINTESGSLQKFNTRLGNIQESIGGMITGMKSLAVKGFEPFLRWVEKITTSRVSEKLEAERFELNKLEIQITSANTKQTDRVKLINELKEKYPALLGNLNAETASNLQVSRAIKAVNDQLVNKIILQKKDEEIDELNQKRADIMNKKLEYEDQIREKLVKLREKGFEVNTSGTDPAAELERVQNNFRKKMDDMGKSTGGIFDPFFGVGTLLNNYAAVKEFDSNTKKFTDKLIDKKNALAKELGIDLDTKDIGTPPPVLVTPVDPKKEAERKRLLEKAKQDHIQFLADIIKNEEDVFQGRLTKNDAEVDAVRLKYDKLRIRAKGNQDELVTIANQEASELTNVLATQAKEEIKIQEEITKKTKEEFLKRNQAQADMAQTIFELGMTVREKEQAQLDKMFEEMVVDAEALGLDSTAIYEAWTNAKIKLDEKHADKHKATEEEKKQFAVEMAQQAADATFAIASRNRQAESQAAIDAINKRREDELANNELSESQKKAINLKYDRQVAAEKQRAWKAEQRASIAQAIINGALAVTKVTAQTGVLAPFVIPSIIAGTLAQVAVILAQKTPQFAKGGLIAQGPSHQEGGISLVNNRTGQNIGEIEGGEPVMVLSKETRQNNGRLINELLYNSRFRNGAPVSVNTNAALGGLAQFRTGGIAAGSQPITVNAQPDLGLLINEIRELKTAVQEEKGRPVDFNYNVFERYRDLVDKIRNNVNA